MNMMKSNLCQDYAVMYTHVALLWRNSVLNQLFFNLTGQFSEMAQEGLISIGSEGLGESLRSAIDIYKENVQLMAHTRGALR